MPLVLVPTAYRGPTRGEAELAVEGKTVLACLEAVEAKFPGFLSQILDGSGEVHGFVKLFVNGEQIDPSALSTELVESLKLLLAKHGQKDGPRFRVALAAYPEREEER